MPYRGIEVSRERCDEANNAAGCYLVAEGKKFHDYEPDSRLGRYANYFQVGHNISEFRIECGLHYEGHVSPQFHTTIITAPEYAKSFLETLQAAVDEYEQRFGRIRR